ncbi:MAG: Dipeptide transport system permease protein DppC, partial [uncultured Thermoleophilia bacterium]
ESRHRPERRTERGREGDRRRLRRRPERHRRSRDDRPAGAEGGRGKGGPSRALAPDPALQEHDRRVLDHAPLDLLRPVRRGAGPQGRLRDELGREARPAEWRASLRDRPARTRRLLPCARGCSRHPHRGPGRHGPRHHPGDDPRPHHGLLRRLGRQRPLAAHRRRPGPAADHPGGRGGRGARTVEPHGDRHRRPGLHAAHRPHRPVGGARRAAARLRPGRAPAERARAVHHVPRDPAQRHAADPGRVHGPAGLRHLHRGRSVVPGLRHPGTISRLGALHLRELHVPVQRQLVAGDVPGARHRLARRGGQPHLGRHPPGGGAV